MISGRELLLLCEKDSDTADTVASIDGITRVEPDDANALDEALWDLYRRHVVLGVMRVPSNAEVAPFSREAVNKQFGALLADVACAGRRPPA